MSSLSVSYGMMLYWVHGEHESSQHKDHQVFQEEKWEKKKEMVVWTSPVGTETGANTIKADARTSEADAQASKQVVVASGPFQEKQHEEATGAKYSGVETGSHPRRPNPLNRVRERRRARLEAERLQAELMRPPGSQGQESGGAIKWL